MRTAICLLLLAFAGCSGREPAPSANFRFTREWLYDGSGASVVFIECDGRKHVVFDASRGAVLLSSEPIQADSKGQQ